MRAISTDKIALVIGASGGIGSALVDALLERRDVDTLIGTFYQSPILKRKDDRLSFQRVNMTDEAEVLSLLGDVASRHGRLDYLINTVGFLHEPSHMPEKEIQQIDSDFFLRNIQLNTLPTLLLAKYAKPLFKKAERPVFASVTARLGSIEENNLGGWYSYRASKAAANMALKTLAVEWRRTLPKAVVAALHPGTTDTALSKPFQGNVPAEKLFSARHASSLMLEVIDQLTPDQSGKFWSWDGSELPW
ncbi:MAG: SDR family NAD(P)-dependent oxidoreductase [bacterium]